ncbi:MAG: acetyl-CoA decarbonylase/synthase complex subunit gamma [Candidatus Atabeyarchaeum deiterrae]
MSKRPSPLELYKYLPQTNCKKCGEDSCMAFAMKLIDRSSELNQCTPLYVPEFKKNVETLEKLTTPPVRVVRIGEGPRAIKIGGKEVVHRHELAYINPTAIAIDVHDEMPEDLILQRVKQTNEFSIVRIGKELKLDLIAVRSVSSDPKKFAKAVDVVAKTANLPMVLCSFDPKVLRAGLEAAKGKKPLIYAATKDNWKDVGSLAVEFNCPVTVFAPGDLSGVKSLAVTLQKGGAPGIVLDPGTVYGEGSLSQTLDRFVMLRRAAIEGGDADVGWPLIGVPAIIWAGKNGNISNAEFIELASKETLLAASLMIRYADILICHTPDMWAMLPAIALRQNLYADPRIHPAVETGVKTVGTPNELSPVFLTTNFALTYYTVRSDIEQAKMDAWMLVLDTGGIGVESSSAGGQLNAGAVAELIKSSGIESRVNHRALIIPGMAARFQGEMEDSTKWDILVGPRDSSAIPDFIREKYTIKPGLRFSGDAKADSPVILTTNSIKSYYSIKVPLEGKMDAWILTLDTGGKDLEQALSEKLVTGQAVTKLMTDAELEKQTKNKKLVVPAQLESLKNDIKKSTGWEVIVAPADPSKLVAFLKKPAGK